MQPAAERARDEYVKLPLSFEVKRGQADSHVQFISRSDGYDVSITPTEALMTLRNSPLAVASAGSPPSPLRMKLIGANSNAPAVGLDELPYKSNYFIGNDPKKWLTDVPAYARVKCQNVYPGIDLFYYGNGGQLEYDFVVAPRANYKAIRILFEGADRIRLDDRGDLAITTAAGEIHHRKPVVYQEKDGLKRAIDARYLLNSSRQLELEIGAYDAGETLVIDPVLNYATYFGSRSGGDALAGVGFDAAGNAYVVGTTASPDLPTTPGALQPAGRSTEAFIAKLNPAGSEVLYVTYLGGSSSDNGNRIAVDRKGNAYVTGTTFSADFPKTSDFGSGAPGLTWHCFVTKLNATGTEIVYSAVLGAPGESAEGVGIAVDDAGQATVAGNTFSSRFPTTPNALQPKSGGSTDAFVARLNRDGSALVFSTYLGGDGQDSVSGLALDEEGNTYVAGNTSSTNFPTTRHAYQRGKEGLGSGFVSKISGSGDRFSYSTLLSSGFPIVYGIAVDREGNAYLTGYTLSSKLPTTPGAVQPVFAGDYEAFVTKLNANGSALVYSTFLGGSGRDFGLAIAVDSLGQAYVAGSTTSADFPLMRPLQPRKHGGPLFKSTDRGGSWDDIPAIAPAILSLVIDPQVTPVLYASTYDDILKSTDSGVTWRVIAPKLSGSLVIDPLRPATLYVVTVRSVYKSTDAGANWRRSEISISGDDIFTAMVIDPKMTDTLYLSARQFPGAFGVQGSDASTGVMFKSTDGGTSWTTLDFGEPVFSVFFLAIDPSTTSTLYASAETPGSNVYKSTDGGEHWFRAISSGIPFISRLVVDPSNSETLYATTFTGILKSTNGGASWSPTGLQRSAHALAIDPQTPSIVYAGVNAGNFEGLYKTTDGGATWRVNLDRVLINAITLDPKQTSTVYAPAIATSDIFVTKLNATGAALLYSTFLGGVAEDSASSIAADDFGNAFVGGISYSLDFPVTPGAYQTTGVRSYTGFVMRIADPIPLRITAVAIKGKKLLVSGEGFDQGAVITVNDTDLQTQNDDATPSVLLISKRGGKQIGRGQTVTIRVRNADGRLSEGFAFTRSLD